jgi:phosphoribosyl-AMP cyclohydrolase
MCSREVVCTSLETLLLCYTFKNSVRTSLETHYFSATHSRIQFVPHWKHTTSLLHIKEFSSYLTGNTLLLCYTFKNSVRTSLETLLLCYTFKNSVRTSLETHYFSATHLKIQFLPHWKHTTSLLHISEFSSFLTGNTLLLCYTFKNSFRTSLETI